MPTLASNEDGPFSRRFGLAANAAPITIRHEAPDDLRHAILALADRAELGWGTIVRVLTNVLLVAPQGNWGASYLEQEVRGLMAGAAWARVYDIAEAIYVSLKAKAEQEWFDKKPHEWFERELNAFFVERGIGWRMDGGKIELRGEDAIAELVHNAADALAAAGRNTAANELQEAWRDLSRRPEPDTTGAVQHALAGVECAVRDFTGQQNATLGKLVADNPGLFPKPLDASVEKLWGYASEFGRHIREGRKPDLANAMVVVGLAVTVASFLAERMRAQT